MLIYIAFFGSFLGIATMLALKMYELQNGAKFFSVARYRVDTLLHKRMEDLSTYSRYANRHTFRAVLILLFEYAVRGLIYLAGVLKETRLWAMVKGQGIAKREGVSSEFLNKIEENRKEDPVNQDRLL